MNISNLQSNITQGSTQTGLNLEILRMTILTPNLICFLCFLYVIVIILKVYFTTPHVQENGRYVLFAHMLISDLIYLTTAITLLLFSMYSVAFPVSICYVMVTASSSSFKVTPYILAVMSLERYVAICFPLRYAEFCTRRKSGIAVAVVWLVGLIPNIADFIMLSSSVNVNFFLTYVHCARTSLLNTAEQNTLRSFIHAMTFTLVGLIIVFTYVKIMVVALKIDSGKSSASKASKTVMLHAVQLLLCMTAFTYPITEMYLRNYIIMLPILNFSLFMCLPRFISPLIYGIRDDVFRDCIRRYVLCKPVRIHVNAI
ncbi:odorant receptor 131-2-like [Spea bombifrons]|uniref:odorant receptor 131-2-like n=1 Tax=Spea bombifrons TaxID=233779 RepID=UPI002349F742|nr:odorant receptor 131-2-like [Spea bombifrons]